MKFRCPSCGKKNHHADSDVGMLAICPACGSSFRITAPPTATATSSNTEAEARPDAANETTSSSLDWARIGLAACLVVAAAGFVLYQTHHFGRSPAKQLARNTTDPGSSQKNPTPHHDRPEIKPPAATLPATRPALAGNSTAQSKKIPERFVAEEPPSPPSAQTTPPAPPTSQPTVVAIAPPAVLSDRAPSTQPTTMPVAIGRPPVRKLNESVDQLSDEKIGQTITSGIDYLLSLFDPKTHLLRGAEDPNTQAAGADILCVYALMQCQQATNDPRLNPKGELMKGLIDSMKRLNLTNYHWETYARGLRSTALALYARPEDAALLKQDAAALVVGSHGGGYTYVLAKSANVRDDAIDRWDNSNSQYGLLGVWSAAEVGFEVPDAYWNLVQRHWMQSQEPDGTWGYNRRRGEEGTHSMTCAGLASLFVTHDYLDIPTYGADVGRDPFTPAVAKGLRWLERGNDSVMLNHGAYDLYGLERVGLASGFKFFGNHEWYRELATQTIATQSRRGWGNEVEAAYSLLFLARGRHPILMNKLRFDGYWANRPRDLANLARFVGYELERPLNWQVVPLSRDWTDWTDSPILYISSHKAIKLTDADYAKIRSFVLNGGLLFMQADGASQDFNRFAHQAAHTLFPDYEMGQLPPAHPLYRAMYKIKPNATLQAVSNGARILMLYSSEDISKYWQMRESVNKPFPFQLGANLFIYAAGKRDMQNHLVSSYIPPLRARATTTYRVARLKYPGNWDPEPEAWHRYSRWFQLNTGYGLEVTEVPIQDLKPETAPVAALTGTARYDLTEAESAALKAYVESGGVLLVDLCGGTGAFDQGLQTSLYFKAFGGAAQVMPRSHLILAGGPNGMDNLSKPLLRQFALDQLGNPTGLPEEIAAGKGHVIATSLDITSGLLGTHTWGINGYEPDYAESLVKNIILWTADGQHTETPLANR
jgi:hypothetical protein